MEPMRRLVGSLWRTDAPLTGLGFAMLGVLLASVAGLAIDPRTITGAPAWLKPAKFAASIAIFAFTLAWVSTHIPEWKRTRRLVSRITVATLGIEIALIVLQAGRGTTSHFNVRTPFDLTVWVVTNRLSGGGSGWVSRSRSSERPRAAS